MSVYKDKPGDCQWPSCGFKGINGISRRTTKRGFKTKEEAEEWGQELKVNSGLRTFTLSEFFRVYERGIRLTAAESAWEGKAAISHDKIKPYFRNAPIEELSIPDVLQWQDPHAVHAQEGRHSLLAHLSERNRQPT